MAIRFSPKIRSETYITYLKSNWLFKGRHEKFDDYLPLFNWIKANNPNNEKNPLSYFVRGLSTLNRSINNNLKNWHQYVEPYEYYTSEKGSWIKLAIGRDFMKPTDPIKWILENKPAYETKSIGFLLRCLRLCNGSVKNKVKPFAIYANAYSYILKNEPARKNMNDAFDALINERRDPGDITFLMMRDKMDLFLFTHLDNEDKYLNIGYINTIIGVYLDLKKLAVKNELHVPEFK